MLNRRNFLATATLAGLSAPAILRAEAGIFRDFPFGLGVAAGDPASDGFVIWTRLAPEPMAPHGGMPPVNIPVEWEVSPDSGFKEIAAKGTELARPELGHSVHVEVAGLQPNRPYYYRFTAGGERSLRGRAKTLPPVGANVDALKFGVAGCQHYESGFYGAYRHLAREDLAFVYHYGDFIYEYSQDYLFPDGLPVRPVRKYALRGLQDLGDFRTAYSQTLFDIDMQAARSQHAFISSFDDHEIRNDWVSVYDDWKMDLDGNDPDAPPPEVFMLRRQAAFQAWYEHMPVRKALLPRGGFIAANRELRYGNLMAMQVLDTRQYRSNQPCGDGFKPTCPEVFAKDAQVLGKAQEDWLAKNLGEGGATWNGIAQQVTMMSLDRRRREDEPKKILNLDSWPGYDAPRERILSRFAGLKNCVVLTGDEHQNFCGDLVHKDKVVGAEVVATSISSGGDGSDQRRGTDVFLKLNPELKFANDQRGYVVCEVGKEAWQSHFMVVDKVTTPTNTLSNRATAVVERDVAGIKMA
ncbi:alkaline phosphatase [Sphingopyxis sp. H050]|jgi:alkaline phosphatase D|uniref:alkaline phosphatase D family protein n=1 Tax=Sphingopyxis sp. H050 TaxID=1759072 RepID=UPI0007373DAB|nr:alkaline phosphatase D family protein [Sphingopyxis sp. H050]KTE21742.1 alkaline phosphatase [Sphingopyxis sp. H050]